MTVISAKCPRCGLHAVGFEDVRELFGFRSIKGKNVLVQSHCRSCRRDEGKLARVAKKIRAELEKQGEITIPAQVQTPAPVKLPEIVTYGSRQHQVGDVVSLHGKNLYRVEADGRLVQVGPDQKPPEVSIPSVKAPVKPARWEDVVLFPEEIKRIESYGPTNIAYYTKGAKVRTYVDLVLFKIPDKSLSRTVGRCCSEGTNYYRRQDLGPIRPEDLDAVKNYFLGQENRVVLVDDHMIEQYWLCDSSD